MFIPKCMHINSQNTRLNTRFYKLWYDIIYLTYFAIKFNIRRYWIFKFKINFNLDFSGSKIKFLEKGIQLLREGIRILKTVFGCQRGTFGYVEYKTWAAGIEGIRIPKEGIRMLKIVSRCWRKAFRYAREWVSRCEKEVSEYVKGHPDTRKRYPDTLQLKLKNRERTTIKT